MATIVAVRTGNWSDTSHLTGPWPGASTPTTKPDVVDTVETDAYTVTIDEDVTVVLLRSTGAGRFEVAAARTITASVDITGTYTGGGLRCTHASGTVTVDGSATNSSATGNAATIRNNGTGTVTLTGNVTGGTGNNQGVFNASTGIVNVGGNATGGSGGGVAIYNSAGGTVNVAGNAVGGTGTISYGVVNIGAGTIAIAGNSTGGSNGTAHGAVNSSTGTLTVAGICYPGTVAGAAGLVGSNSGGTTTYKKAVIGGALGTPVSGYVKLLVDATVNFIRTVNSSGGTDYDLSNDYPTEAQVESGVVYKLGTLTGTLVAGSCDYPAESDVRLGVDYDTGASTGTLDLPAVADVQDGVTFDGATKTGTFVAPAVGDVQSGVTYGAAAEFTGTFASPAVGDVEAGVTYGASAEFTGTFAVPTEAQVELGIGFGAGGTEFTGSLAGGGVPDWTADEKNQIRQALGITGMTAATSGTGTLEAAFAALATDDELAATTKTALEADGSKLDHLWEMTEDDGGVRRLTTNALELAPSGGSAPSAATVADAVWDEALAGHVIVGSAGAGLAAAGSAGDPWSTTLPGAYTGNQAGAILDSIRDVTDAIDVSAVIVAASNDAGVLTVIQSVTFGATVSGLTISATWAKLYWTLKESIYDDDDQAIIQLVESNPGVGTDGLLYLDSAAIVVPITVADGTLTVNQAAGTVVIAVTDNATALLSAASELVWDIKTKDAAGATVQNTTGTASIVRAVTQTI